jgi:hypothetical protein
MSGLLLLHAQALADKARSAVLTSEGVSLSVLTSRLKGGVLKC